MATVLHGDSHFVTAIMYGGIQNSMKNYVQQEIERSQGLVTGVGQAMLQKAVDLRNDFVNSNAFRLAEAAVRQFQSLWGQDKVQPLGELWQIQNAPLVMQPYLMANPTIRTLYQQQRCDGYSGSYIDLEPGVIGNQHTDWQRVMQGLLQERVVGDTTEDVFITYAVDEPDEMVPLSFDGQLDVLDAWQKMDTAIANGVDPTSRWNDDLG